MAKKLQLEELLSFSKDELEMKLKETYEKQKLKPTMRKIARIIDILTLLLLALSEGFTIWGGIWLIGAIYIIYILFNPKAEDEAIYKELEELVTNIEKYKIYRNKSTVDHDEKLVKKMDKNIKIYLPKLLESSKFAKVVAVIPVVSLFIDETHEYTNAKYGALSTLLNGTDYLKNGGLRKFIRNQEE